jgi:glycosyltransferase involved in cell wall biosynthesis
VRIAIATRHRDHVGGVETYLERLLPQLSGRGHDLMLWHEFEGGAAPIAAPPGTDTCSVSALGQREAMSRLSAWKPDVVFVQGLSRPEMEAGLLSAGACVLFLHTYHGTCVGGTKTHAFPGVRPCTRTLGPGCLVHYFPRRCGGLSPITMIARYRTESAHLDLLGRYGAITVLSDHMRREALAHGAAPARLAVLPPPIEGPADPSLPDARRERLARAADPREPLRLLFLGRLEPVKGGDVLIEAAFDLARRLGRNIHLALVGEGRSRSAWERLAARALSGASGVSVSFPGRVDVCGRDQWFGWADLLVVPSRWPEPFGLVGAEAAASGLPAVAFDVGGTRDWLDDEETGRLVGHGRLDPTALCDAIAWTVETPDRLHGLGAAARRKASGWSMARHADAVTQVLRRAAGERAG